MLGGIHDDEARNRYERKDKTARYFSRFIRLLEQDNNQWQYLARYIVCMARALPF